MKAREIKRLLVARGWSIEQGSRHELAVHPDKPEVIVPIPRHKGDLPIGTLQSILKATGLKDEPESI